MLLRSTGFVLVGLLSACSNIQTVRGSGTVLVEERDVSAFHAIKISGSADVVLTQGDHEALSIECDDNLLPHILATVEDGVLHVRFESGSWSPSQRTVYRVDAKEIDSVRLSGSVDLKANELRAPSFRFRLSGSGSAEIAALETETVAFTTSGSANVSIGVLGAESTDVDISGSGEITVDSGDAGALTLDVSGSGDLDMPAVRAETAVLEMSGSSEAKIWVETEINAKISGSGEVIYGGSPKIQTSIKGSGRIRAAE